MAVFVSRNESSDRLLGNVAHGEVVNREYRIKTLDNMDSGFEGLSAFYYSRISYTLSIVELPNTGGFQPPVWAVALMTGIGVALAGLGLTALRLRHQR